MSTNIWVELPSVSWRPPVPNATFLPTGGNQIGDAIITQDTDTIYVWNGTSWIAVATPGAAIALDGLIGDVSATGPGVATATVNFVDGVSAANVASGATAANAATSTNTPNTIVKRDGSGNFSAGTITASLSGNATNIIATSNSTLTTLSALSLPTTQLTGTLQASQEPAHTGDVTNTAGSLVLSLVATSNATLSTLSALSLPYTQVTGLTQGSIIFAGVSGQLTQDNANFYWNDSTLNLGLGIIPATNLTIDTVNSTGVSKAIQSTSYGVGSTIPFRGRFARGTLLSPAAAQAGDVLSVLSGRGYGTSQFAAASTGTINIVAGETFTNASNATYIQFQVTGTGSVTIAEAMRVNSTGNLLIGTTTDSGTEKLQVQGNSNVGTVTTGIWNGTNTSGNSFLTSGTTFTTASTTTTATRYKITLVGGGGSGAGTPATANNRGGGGGAGGVAIVYVTGLTASTAYTYAIGAGGAGVSNSAGNVGGNTTITINATTYTASGGGVASGSGSSQTGGVGGSTTNATIGLTGGNGGAVPAASAAAIPIGNGGSNQWGQGASPLILDANSNGNNAVNYGGGGGGAVAGPSSPAAGTGGNGGNGCILIEWQN